MLSHFSRRALIGAISFAALVGLLRSEMDLRAYEARSREIETVLYVPKAEVLRPFLLGQDGFLADLIWIRTLGYFADEFYGRGKYQYLQDLLNLATDLDPRFEKIYIWAGAALMYNAGRIGRQKILASSRFLEKGWRFIQQDPVGWKHDPRYWMIPQMIGFNYAIELHDRVRGAPFIAAAGKISGAPIMYKTWAATLYSQAGQTEKGVEVLEDMLAIDTLNAQLSNVRESRVRNIIQARLEEYYRRLYGDTGAARIDLLERRIRQLVSEWRKTFSYINFDLFLIVRPTELDAEEVKEQESLWPYL
ncbi:MAG: hypothetical protein V1798_08345 [Pseudomonadota bacterium]